MPRADEAVALRDPAQERQEQPDRELGGRPGEHVRRVRDHDAVPARRVEVDVVDSDAVVGDDPELGPGGVEEVVVDSRGQHGDDPVRTRRRVDELEVADDRLLHFPGDRLDEMDTRRHG